MRHLTTSVGIGNEVVADANEKLVDVSGTWGIHRRRFGFGFGFGFGAAGSGVEREMKRRRRRFRLLFHTKIDVGVSMGFDSCSKRFKMERLFKGILEFLSRFLEKRRRQCLSSISRVSSLKSYRYHRF